MLKLFALAALVAPVVAAGDKIVVQEGDLAPLFEGDWLSHEASSLAQLEGSLVFIEFWRTW